MVTDWDVGMAKEVKSIQKDDHICKRLLAPVATILS